jgi:hypothetical protein
MTKALSNGKSQNYHVIANEDFFTSLTFKLIFTCFINSFSSRKKAQSIAYLLSGSEHVYWIVGLEVKVHSIWVLWTRGAFKNARSTTSFRTLA